MIKIRKIVKNLGIIFIITHQRGKCKAGPLRPNCPLTSPFNMFYIKNRMANKKLTYYLLAALGIVGIGAVTLLIIYSQKTKPQPATTQQPTIPPLEEKEHFAAPPTLTQEQIEIIKKVENHYVDITATGFNPKELKIKLYDQVTWTNKDTKIHKISGEGWGNVPIGPGERFTQAFEKAGTYNYSCSLQPELKGTVIVE